jgi:hypothetical protein
MNLKVIFTMSCLTDLIENGIKAIKMFSESSILICEVCIWTFQNISVNYQGGVTVVRVVTGALQIGRRREL